MKLPSFDQPFQTFMEQCHTAYAALCKANPINTYLAETPGAANFVQALWAREYYCHHARQVL